MLTEHTKKTMLWKQTQLRNKHDQYLLWTESKKKDKLSDNYSLFVCIWKLPIPGVQLIKVCKAQIFTLKNGTTLNILSFWKRKMA